MGKIIIIGGGWAGCSAALTAKKNGCQVEVLERTDLLIGLGNVGGIMRNNGRFTAAEENIAMGNGELFQITDNCATHKNVDFPGHSHGTFYDVLKVEPEVGKLLRQRDIQVRFMTRAVDVEMREGTHSIEAVVLGSGEKIYGDVFIDCTGTTGPMGNCVENGNGCSMCVLRCPSFGPRVSISKKAGGHDFAGQREDGKLGAFSGSCKLEKRTLSKALREKLDEDGVVIVPLPHSLINEDKLKQKVCQQYALKPFSENIILIDTGFAKMMTPYFPLEQLRQVEGFETARYADPYSGGKGNSIRYMAVTQRDNTLKVDNVDNLFCAGEKAGLYVGHTEAITTGALAGLNSSKMAQGQPLVTLPETTAIGAFVNLHNQAVKGENGLQKRLTFAGGDFFQYMKEQHLYSTDPTLIRERIKAAGLENLYCKCLQSKSIKVST